MRRRKRVDNWGFNTDSGRRRMRTRRKCVDNWRFDTDSGRRTRTRSGSGRGEFVVCAEGGDECAEIHGYAGRFLRWWWVGVVVQ